jgi:hypothetical protein
MRRAQPSGAPSGRRKRCGGCWTLVASAATVPHSRRCCNEAWARVSQDDVVSQAKKLAKRGPQAVEAGSKPEAGGEDEGTEERQADTAPAIALD